MQNMAKYPVEMNGVIFGATREIKVVYRFNINELPDTIRLLGAYDFHIDVKVDDIKKKLLALTDDEVLTIGRAPEVDKQVAELKENRISRMHVIFQKVGDEILLINLGHYGTIALKKTEFGLESIASSPAPWEDADWIHANGRLTKEEQVAAKKAREEAYARAMENRPLWRKLLGMKPATVSV